MSIDSSLVRSLNAWGEQHTSLVRIGSNDLVYAVILLSLLWFAVKTIKVHPITEGWKVLVRNLFAKGLVIFALPVGIATLLSEAISALYVRQRPFVTDPNVKLLVPHGADGGMPSHHIVFMTSLVISIYFYDKKVATLLGLLTLISGIARIGAGIHYPTDVIAGVLLGIGVIYVYRRSLLRFEIKKHLTFD